MWHTKSPRSIASFMAAEIYQPRSAMRGDRVDFDPDAVRAFEHAGWQQAAAGYDSSFARATAQFVDVLLDAAGVAEGSRVLDLCCGTGLVAAAAARRGALPYPDRSFDAVVANLGIHHVPRPDKAIGEAMRVLQPGGRLTFTSWAVPADNVAWRLLFDAIRAYGDMEAAATAPPSGGNLGTSEAVLHLLRNAGFAVCRAAAVHREWLVDEPRDIVVALARGTVRTAAVIAAQDARALPAIEAAVAAAAAPYRRGDHFAVPIVAILAYGVKPGA